MIKHELAREDVIIYGRFLLTGISDFRPTTSVDLFGDFPPAPEICKDFFTIRPELLNQTSNQWQNSAYDVAGYWGQGTVTAV
jgi:hypothetical protein